MASRHAADLSFRPVGKDTLSDFEALFNSPGAPKHCWCMVWRRTTAEAKENSGPDRKRQIFQRIAAGVPVGLIAYQDGTPMGWVSVAPRETYRNLGGRPATPGETVWAVVCFWVPRKRRGEGLVYRLIEAAVEHARDKGATAVEAYPVPPDAPSYRFMGFVPAFEKAGLTDVGAAGIRRRVMRLQLG
ncbi:MAG: GNAT family N-acetyltransferase [Bauldia sp.]|nr:GNAT family N-acetyltransferase [Bauldia sp.]